MSAKFIDFLRNWGESLFTSKKKFIAQQPLPNVLHSQQSVSTGDGGYQDFVSPVDGFVTIDTEQKESGIRFRMMVKKTAGYLVGTSFFLFVFLFRFGRGIGIDVFPFVDDGFPKRCEDHDGGEDGRDQMFLFHIVLIIIKERGRKEKDSAALFIRFRNRR